MRIEKYGKYVVLEDEKDTIQEFASFLEYILPNKFENENIVIDLLKYDSFNLEELLYFLKISTYHRSTGHSFVLVNNSINPEDVPNEMVVVPTRQEAEDIIELEEIERDLGF